MIIYKCDTCEKSEKNTVPDNWLNINGSIRNNLKYRSIISCSLNLHFCSRNCFEHYFFLAPNIDWFDREMRGFKNTIAKTNLTDLEKRTAFFEYYKENYDLEKTKILKNDINSLIDFYFPLPKDDD